MFALSEPTTITISVVGLFAFLAIVVLVRLVLRKDESNWRRYRIGVFVEKDNQGEEKPPDAR